MQKVRISFKTQVLPEDEATLQKPDRSQYRVLFPPVEVRKMHPCPFSS